MVCSLSVSATGITAILIQFPIQVSQTTTISVGDVQGDLWGERYGANDNDLVMQHLFKNGVGVQQAEMAYFCQDVSFSQESKQIEYIFKFVLANDAQNGVLIELTNAGLSNPATYIAKYSYAYGKEEPNWSTADDVKPETTYVVEEDDPYIWLRATLSVREDIVSRLDSAAVWSFTFTFTGIAVSSQGA